MGLCLGTELTEEKKARIRSAEIDRDLYEFAKMEMNVVKILLLGESANVWRPVCVSARATAAGIFVGSDDNKNDEAFRTCFYLPPGAAESGKSTLVKQMKIIHSNGFTKQELITFKVAKKAQIQTADTCLWGGRGGSIILRLHGRIQQQISGGQIRAGMQ